jgi:hypothetical protein
MARRLGARLIVFVAVFAILMILAQLAGLLDTA